MGSFGTTRGDQTAPDDVFDPREAALNGVGLGPRHQSQLLGRSASRRPGSGPSPRPGSRVAIGHLANRNLLDGPIHAATGQRRQQHGHSDNDQRSVATIHKLLGSPRRGIATSQPSTRIVDLATRLIDAPAASPEQRGKRPDERVLARVGHRDRDSAHGVATPDRLAAGGHG